MVCTLKHDHKYSVFKHKPGKLNLKEENVVPCQGLTTSKVYSAIVHYFVNVEKP